MAIDEALFQNCKKKFNLKLNGYRVYNDKNKGFYERPSNRLPKEEFNVAYNSRYETIDRNISQENLDYFLKFIKLCENNNIELILVRTPILQMNRRLSKHTESLFMPLVDNYNLKYYNFDYYFDDLNLIYEDYYDLGHVSKSGAKKVSVLFSNLLLKDFNSTIKKTNEQIGN